MATAPTTVAKTVSIQLGLATVHGSLRTVRNTEKPAKYRSICPACLEADAANGVPVIQQYSCVHEHGPFLPGAVKKGREVGDRIVPLSAADMLAVAGDSDDGDDGKAMDLRIHPAQEFPMVARPTGIVYAFDPGPGKAEMVGILLDLLAEGRFALVGELTVKKVRRIFRLVAANHGIELVEIARPEDVYAFEDREYPVTERNAAMMRTLVEALTTHYDPADYRNGAAERLAAVLASKEEDGPTATVTTLPRPAGNDLEALLTASLAAAEAGRAAA